MTKLVSASMGNVLKDVNLDISETNVGTTATVTALDQTMCVAVVPEYVTQAVNQGTQKPSVIKVSKDKT